MIVRLPREEFDQRHARIREKLTFRGLDALLVHSNEADFANVRYLSDYWPAFESAGVFVPREGTSLLIIGPESETFARDRSVLPEIRKLLCYRESAEPDYPGVELDDFREIFSAANNGQGVRRLGIAGATAMPITVYDAIREGLPEGEILRADDILHEMRSIKSDAEIEVMRQAFKISELAMADVLAGIRPGMTELQVVGIAQEAVYRHGGEYEAHPLYVLAGSHSTHAIGRPTHRVIEKGDLVQLNIGARLAGYSPSIGLPVFMGRMDAATRDLVTFGLEAHLKTTEWMQAGEPAGSVAVKFFDFVRSRGYGDNLLYGPCHGLGMMEVEPPWMETSSVYPLQENMTFQVDTFLAGPDIGLRWETGARITSGSPEIFSTRFRQVVEIE